MKNFIQKLLNKDLYPELTKAGGLSIGLNNAFEAINSEIRVENERPKERPFSYARIEKNNKFSQVYIASEEKLYLSDFWKDGVCLANGKTDNITNLVKSLHVWLNNDISTKELSLKFNFIHPNKKSESFDDENEIEYTWNKILNDGFAELNPFIQLAIKDHLISKLFPYTSLYTLCFSRCTGYPYDSLDLPNVTPKSNSWSLPKEIKQKTNKNPSTGEIIYIVTKNRNQYLGEGNAKETLELVKSNLPKDLALAKKGISKN
ncbi:DUF6193 family natural product biosynthesis protein [uncultured Tenacibaculum sp.]|uniref:DUF6193 family natural product biosynthesis protein n=1 Tax=uncultured Tenacibaculum sp. TaxID=174713 RepID=UPI002638E9B4|nr:DUF6193 family natural product biosynthesis protein [uncultured Tenacibaculum sp.]